MQDKIVIKGARENNLKNIDVVIPRDKLVVLTGLSGSGKSSLAFETLYAEGQRRYVESLSSYARMFLGQMEKPDVDYIEGLSPAISIDQKTTSKNPRSTVGTVTEIYDYLRLLWARVGAPPCPNCGKEIRQQTIDQIIDQVMTLPEATRIQVLSPVIRGKKGEHNKVFEDARKSGYVRVRADGSLYDLTEEIKLDKNKKHSIEIVVDRLVIREDVARRLTDSVETASNLSGGIVVINVLGDEERDITFSQNYACEDCGVSIEELSPRMFSFNNPYGACPACTGLGSQMKIDPDRIIPNRALSILEGAITASGWNHIKSDGISRMYFDALAKKYKFKLTDPVEKLSKEVVDVILYGTKGEKLTLNYDQPRGKGTLYQPFEGIVNNLERRYRETQSDAMKREIEECMSECPCPECQGRRLKREALAVTVGGSSIHTFCEKPVDEALAFLDTVTLTETQAMIADQILKEIRSRLGFLRSVGLQYLTLTRQAGTLSGGESQRIRLATQIGSSLMGVLYILDEPSIGLHQRDNDLLLATLKRLRDLGNTLIVVEHDEDTMRAADYIVDIGPGAGVHGGQVVACGTAEQVMNTPGSVTGDYLAGRKKVPVPAQRREGSGRLLTVRGAAENNLRHIDVGFPLGAFIAVTGVSGSGKSSLVNEILYKRLGAELNRTKARPGKHDGIDGIEFLDKVIAIDQSPIGRTPRSNPATYTGLFNDIRELFASTQDAKTRGY
ncbi:MAG: excinuclease ABC subunit UvrA, partial [Oscillospiraceae bacterium]